MRNGTLKTVKTALLLLSALASGSVAMAQPRFGLEYHSELQVSHAGDVNFPNLLRLAAEVPLAKGLSFEAGTLSIVRTRDDRILDDFQVFSNIDEENLPLALSLASFNVDLSRHRLSFGIRNMNLEYFASDVTSLFTGASCGIFPTLSANMEIANFPLASMGVHYSFSTIGESGDGGWRADASLYNGRGYKAFAGRENVFRFCPGSDGLFAIAQGTYVHGGSSYFLGGCLQSGGKDDAGAGYNDPVWALWTYAEQNLAPALDMIACLSHSSGFCSDFAGLGLRYSRKAAQLGVFSDYVRLDGSGYEWATELTCRFAVGRVLSLQPAMHLIVSDGHVWGAGLFRISVGL